MEFKKNYDVDENEYDNQNSTIPKSNPKLNPDPKLDSKYEVWSAEAKMTKLYDERTKNALCIDQNVLTQN